VFEAITGAREGSSSGSRDDFHKRTIISHIANIIVSTDVRYREITTRGDLQAINILR